MKAIHETDRQNDLQKRMINFIEQLQQLGLKNNDTVIVHGSFKALGITAPEAFILAIINVLGGDGTLLMPALSDEQHPANVHNTKTTPSNVGYLAEYFRIREGTLRSLHPTHSVCGVGGKARELLEKHVQDTTPCGPNSPFNQLFNRHGKILMVGCGLEPNTSIHAIEEYAPLPYLFGSPVVYTITDANGNTFDKAYLPHDFEGYTQRYDRVEELLGAEGLKTGMVGTAKSYLLNSEILFDRVLALLKKDPFYFVDRDVDEG